MVKKKAMVLKIKRKKKQKTKQNNTKNKRQRYCPVEKKKNKGHLENVHGYFYQLI